MSQTDVLVALFVTLTILTLGVWIKHLVWPLTNHTFIPVLIAAGVTAATLLAIRPWAVVDYCNVGPTEVLCFSEPRWRVLWDTYYSPWQYRVPLMA